MGDPQSVAEPDASTLLAWLNDHGDVFARPTRVTLEHIFFDRTRRGGSTASAARDARKTLMSGADPTSMGDPFLRGARFSPQTAEGLSGVFGVGFSREAFALPLGQWQTLDEVKGQSTERVTHRFDPTPTDRVRLWVTATNGPTSMVSEVEVYEK